MWTNLEHTIWNQLNTAGLQTRPLYLLAISGGIDSMVLLNVFKNIRPQADIVLMHYHHGDSKNLKFRDDCLDFIKSFADTKTENNIKTNNIIIEYDRSELVLKSENDFRSARQDFFNKIMKKHGQNFYLTAHHQDDVLETQLLKLIRGSGFDSLGNFKQWNQQIYRPFFNISKKTLLEYAAEKNVKWIDDPTNSENQYLRNWLRNDWLPQLELKKQGGIANLAKSINNLLSETNSETENLKAESVRYITFGTDKIKIDRLWLNSLGTKDQQIVLIRAIRNSFAIDFSTNQIKEAQRRLDKKQNEHIFHIAGLNWVINTETIVLTYLDKNKT